MKFIIVFFFIIFFIIGFFIGSKKIVKQYNKEIDKCKLLQTKYLINAQILDIWLMLEKNDIGIEDYLLKNDITTIAIYGTWVLGFRLFYQLKGTPITVKYAIDKNPQKKICGLETYKPDDDLEKVDAVIVTPLLYYDEINRLLKEKGFDRIIALDEILYDLVNQI